MSPRCLVSILITVILPAAGFGADGISAGASLVRARGEAGADKPQWSIPATRTARADETATLRNTDFETTRPDGGVAEWNFFRDETQFPYIDEGTSLARSGRRAVRSGAGFGFFQQIVLPVSPLETMAITGYARREFPEEKAGSRTVIYGPALQFIEELNTFSPVGAEPGEFGEFWISQTPTTGTAHAQIFLRGEAGSSWPAFDDLRIYTEQLTSSTAPAWGEPWQLQGGAGQAAGVLTMPPGAKASQRVAAGLASQEYFVWARVSSAAGGSSLTITQAWLPRDGSESSESTATAHAVPESGVIVSDPGRPGGRASGQMKVTVESAGAGPVTLHDVRRGFAMVEPHTLTTGPATPDTPLELTAAWPGCLTTATVQIFSGASAVANIPLEREGTAVRGYWDGGTVSSGTYTARFTLTAADGEQVSVDRLFNIIREDDESAVVPPVHEAEFMRTAWIFLGGQSVSQITALINEARADGFNFLFMTCGASQVANVRQAAEATGMPFMLFVPELLNYAQSFARQSWFSKAALLEKAREILQPALGSPLYRGAYLTDGFVTPKGIDVNRRVTLAFAQDGTLGPAWVFPDDQYSQANVDAIQPPVGLFGIYPFNTLRGGPVEAMLDGLRNEVESAARLSAAGRALWVVVQCFTSNGLEVYYPITNAMHKMQLGATVMSGARAYVVFTYSDMLVQSAAEGGVLPSQVTRLAYREFNAVMDRLGPLVMTLGPAERLATAPEPFAVTWASDGSGQRYVHVLNADDRSTRTLAVGLAGAPAGPLNDIVGERSLERGAGGEVLVPLGPGGWAMIPVGTGTVTGATPGAVESPAPMGLELPVTHEFTISGPNASGTQPLYDVELKDDGRAVGASIGLYPYIPSRPQVYHLGAAGAVQQEPGLPQYTADSFGFSGDLITAYSANHGVRFFSPGAMAGDPVLEYAGRSGGAFKVVRSGDDVWLSMFYPGVRRLDIEGGDLVSRETGDATFRGPYAELFGPFADGSMTVVSISSGIRNLKPGALTASPYTVISNADRHASMSSGRVVAVPRHYRGVALVQLSETGEPGAVTSVARELVDACATAWISDHILAVAEGSRGVVFYSVMADGSAVRVGGWDLPLAQRYYITALSAAAGRLAVALYDGRVIVADTSLVRDKTAARAYWQLLD